MICPVCKADMLFDIDHLVCPFCGYTDETNYGFTELTSQSESFTSSLTQKIIATVRTTENEAIIQAIREYAKEKGNVHLMEIPEETLVKILELGTKALNKEKENDKD